MPNFRSFYSCMGHGRVLAVNEGADDKTQAWLESMDGNRVMIEGNTSIGRAPGNLLILNEEKVSRRHATINPQSNGEFLFIDLGSSNGSYINGRRVSQPWLLNDGDRIEIGSRAFRFRHSHPPSGALAFNEPETEKTIQDIRSMNCWLLVADIEGSTQLIQRIPQAEATNQTTRWLAECRNLIESHHGIMNKFLGDGFLAYWRDNSKAISMVADAIRVLIERQQGEGPRYRMVLHYGQVFVGGAASLGEESLLGNEVNFVFRMEKVAASLGRLCLLSEPARQRLSDVLPMPDECRAAVSGFEGEFNFFSP